MTIPCMLLPLLLGLSLQEETPAEAKKDDAFKAKDPLQIEIPKVIEGAKARWTADWFGAMDEARRRNCPMLVIMSDDQAVGFRTMWNNVFGTPEFAKFAQTVVLVIAFDGQEMPMEVREVDGRKIEWDTTFDVAVRDRILNYRRVKGLFVKREFWNPLQLLLDSYSIEITRMEGHEVTLERLKEETEFVQKEELAGEAIGIVEYVEVLTRVKELVDARHKSGHHKAISEFARIAKELAGKQGMLEYLEELEQALMREGHTWITEAKELIEAGEKKQARKLLLKISRGFRGSELAKSARLMVKEL